MDVAVVAAWITAIGVAVAGAALSYDFYKGRLDKKEKDRSAHARWRFIVSNDDVTDDEPYRSALICHKVDNEQPCIIVSVRLDTEERYELLSAEEVYPAAEPPINLTPGAEMTYAKLDARHLFIRNVVKEKQAYTEAWFYISVPVRPPTSFEPHTIARISVTVEDAFSTRRRRAIPLTSIKIPWASRRAERMT